MNFSGHNKALSYAVLVSVLLHGVLLFVRFAPPVALNILPPDPTLEVVLVNAKSRTAPYAAEAVAQANFDGGGNHESGQPTSPLPASQQVSEGALLAASKQKIDALEKQQKELAAKLREELNAKKARSKAQPAENSRKDSGIQNSSESQAVLATRAAAIEKDIQEQGARPKKVHITPRTREVGYAMYYKSMQRKIENIGTLNFPQRNGRKLYGELTIYIPVAQDGTLYENEGGPRVERSSGNAALDQAALRIVRRAAPFGPFPPKMRSGSNGEVWVIVTRFKFTRDDALQTESGS